MVNYSNGKIYKIEPVVEHDEGEIYIGCTTKKYLSQRMDSHRTNYKDFKEGKRTMKCTVCSLFDKYGLDNCEIILLESVNAQTKDELVAREKFYIKSYKCINKMVPGRSRKEYKIDTNYYEVNKDRILNVCKEYREKNKEEIKIKKKEYRKNNKEAIAERKSKRILCECGMESTSSHMQRHKRTDKHKKLMEAKQQLPEAEN
jgi:hypothetical protein